MQIRNSWLDIQRSLVELQLLVAMATDIHKKLMASGFSSKEQYVQPTTSKLNGSWERRNRGGRPHRLESRRSNVGYFGLEFRATAICSSSNRATTIIGSSIGCESAVIGSPIS